MKRVVLLKKCEHAGVYVKSMMKGLECIGSFLCGDKRAELYKLPGSTDFGIIFSDALCQIHPHAWHVNRKLDPPPRNPLNVRIKVMPVDVRGITEIRIVRFPARVRTDRQLTKRVELRR